MYSIPQLQVSLEIIIILKYKYEFKINYITYLPTGIAK